GRGAHVDFAADAIPLRIVGGGPPRGVARDVPDDPVVRLDRLLEAAVHLDLAPVLHALVLDPLVVRDRHAARVGDDVRDQLDAALGEDAVALRRGRTVGALGNQLDLQALRDRTVDLAS